MKTSRTSHKQQPSADPLIPRRLDQTKAVRGKYYDRMREGTNLMVIAPDLLDTFPDSDSVNEALRSLKKIATRSIQPISRNRKAAIGGR